MKLFVYGGQIQKPFIKYTAKLTKKEKPEICFIPTASADNQHYIKYWFELCKDLNIIPYVLGVWISSGSQKVSFKDILLNMDAIIIGGGNTLNMLAIWKAQEIDTVLKQAYEKGIVLAGGSAGSMCWFHSGKTDSRPKELSIVHGLNILNYSHCPHYHSEITRKPLYHEDILNGNLPNGYACDDKSGIVFVDGKVEKSVSIDEKNNSYFVYKKDGSVIEKKLNSEIIS